MEDKKDKLPKNSRDKIDKDLLVLLITRLVNKF